MTLSSKIPRRRQPSERTELIKQYEERFGAKLVTADGAGITSAKELSAEELSQLDQERAAKYLAEIRQGLLSGIDQVMCSCGVASVREAIVRQLSADERSRVHFTFFDLPIPPATVRL